MLLAQSSCGNNAILWSSRNNRPHVADGVAFFTVILRWEDAERLTSSDPFEPEASCIHLVERTGRANPSLIVRAGGESDGTLAFGQRGPAS